MTDRQTPADSSRPDPGAVRLSVDADLIPMSAVTTRDKRHLDRRQADVTSFSDWIGSADRPIIRHGQ